MPYCPNCGAQIDPGNKFCSNCGSQLNQASVQATPKPVGEQVFATISQLTKGMLGREHYVMLMTPQRLLFVRLTGDDRTEISRAITDEAMKDGAGFFGRMVAGLSASSNMGDYFIGWTPQQVSARYEVFTVPLSAVRELRIKSMNTTDYDNKYELRIKSNGFNEKFRLSRVEKEEHQALKRLLGGRFKSNQWFL